MGTWGKVSQWCNRLLRIIVILRGRFCFGKRSARREGLGSVDVGLEGGARAIPDDSMEMSGNLGHNLLCETEPVLSRGSIDYLTYGMEEHYRRDR